MSTKIIQKEIIEKSCDICGAINPPIDAYVRFDFSYYSNGLDMKRNRFEFCSECASDLWKTIKEKYPKLELLDDGVI